MRYDKVMVVDLKPETERLVLEEIRNGHFSSLDEIIESGIRARRHPVPSGTSRVDAVAHIRAQRKGNRLPEGVSIRDLINEGRD
jgi:hypothetical protein